jgi:tRNA A37 threonylcarbamoyladenosine biosynthesis protein TsaE
LADERKLYHFDLYRLNSEQELSAIGFEEYLDTGAYVFIEWPQIAAVYTEAMNRLTITDDGGVRQIRFLVASGEWRVASDERSCLRSPLLKPRGNWKPMESLLSPL